MPEKPRSEIQDLTFVGLGEILWDLLPDGKQLGGAPANFAFHAHALGARAFVASRVGEDAPGTEILERLQVLGLSTDYIQRDPEHPTGTVQVRLDADGKPDFTITEAVAWDHLAWTRHLEELAGRTDAVCFGSLAQRAPDSEFAIRCFLRAVGPGALRVCDVNLRQRFYDAPVLAESLRNADVLKLNEDELPELARIFELAPGEPPERCRALIDLYELRLVCLTRGARGSLLVTADALDEHPGFPAEVADTVGAGDAFTAALSVHVARGSSLARINEAANRYAAWTATRPGATPDPNPDVIEAVLAA
jgi:fructokinase